MITCGTGPRVSPSQYRRRCQARGAGIVELLLVTPVAMLLIFEIIQYGIIVSTEYIVRDAATVAARYAVLRELGKGAMTAVEREGRAREILVVAKESLARSTLDPGNLTGTVEFEDVLPQSGERVTHVNLTYNLSLGLPFSATGASVGTYPVSVEAIMP